MYNQMYGSGDWGPVNTSWGGHEWWFGHLPFLAAIFAPLLVLVILWSLFWKGLALWHSARRASPWWFVVILVVNTLGILEIVYLFGIAKLSVNQLFSKHAPHEH
jgi:hypothetical protein